MKRYILPIVFGLICFLSCTKEDAIVVERDSYKRAYDVNSTDENWKFLSEYFFDYDKLLLLDADTSDYVYNFQSKNEIRAEKITEGAEYQAAVIALTKEVLLDNFSSEFKKKYFPYTMVVADSITYYGGFNPRMELTYGSRSLFMFTVNEEILAYDAAKKKEYTNKVLLSFFADYLIGDNRIALPVEFYTPCEPFYGTYDDELTNEQGWQNGFIEVSISLWGNNYPSKADDMANLMEYVFTTPQDEIDTFVSQYPVLKERCDLLINYLTDLGFDLNNLK